MFVSLNDLQQLRTDHRKQRIGYVVGTFDLFHTGHLDYLEWAWDRCDLLFVCVRNDARVKQVKGDDRPIIPEFDRARIVNSLKGTAFTHIAPDIPDTGKPSIKIAELLKPDIVIIGNDWGQEAPGWKQALSNSHVTVCPMPYVNSTTKIINRIRHYRES